MNHSTGRELVACRSLVGAVMGVLALAPAMTSAQQPSTAPADEIVVTSSLISQPRRQIGTAVSIIDAADIELRGYANLADVLRTQPGIAVSSSGGLGKDTAVRIRSEESYRTTLLIDGIKAVDPSAPRVAPSFDSLLTTSDVQRVEVLRGPQGFIYGADAGGVVNVITKRGADALGGQLGLELGALDTRKVEGALSGGGDSGDYFVSITDLATDGFNSRTDDTDLRDPDGADNTTVHAKLGLRLSDDLRLQLVARDVDFSSRFDNCFPGNDCVATTDQSVYRLSADYTAGALSSTFGYSDYDVARDSLNAGASTFPTQGELGRLEYTGSVSPTEAVTLVFGLDFQDERLESSDTVRSRDQRGYYVEYQGTFASAFFVSAGARYDDNDDFGTHLSSRVSVAYLRDLGLGRALKYRASFGTGFRAPSLYELAYNAGPFAAPPAAGLSLREENSEGYDVGVEYSGASGLRVEVTYFDQSLDDEITFDLLAYSGYLQSPGTSASKGIELAANVPLAARFTLVVNWTRNDSDDLLAQRRLRRPESFGNFGVFFRPNDRLSLVANVRASRDAVDIGNAPLDDYEIVDLAATYRIKATLDLYGRIENATDADYVEVVGYHTAGRTANVGMRMRF